MADMSNTTLPIQHSTQSLPGVLRVETYTLDDIELTEHYDDATGEFFFGDVSMFHGIKVGTVTAGGISLDVPMLRVTDHASMEQYIRDLQRLDAFLTAVCKIYQKTSEE